MMTVGGDNETLPGTYLT